tara:strand:+ start:433 stop:726 length:294 start_codon:yes stop_codon:yes gene_type:complete
MKTFKEFKEAYGDKHQGHDVDNGPKKSEKKMKGKKTVPLKSGTSVTTMPKVPHGPDKALGVKEEKQKGVDGKVCWKGYKRMGTKKKGGKTVDNCVKA